MKKLFVCFVSISLVLIFCLGMTGEIAAEYIDTEKAAISGKGVIYVPADTASVSFSVETRAQDQREAKDKNEKIVDALKSACARLGTVSEDSFYSYADQCSGGYTFTRCMTIAAGNPDSVGLISQKLLEGGATGINYICYSVKDLRPYEGRVLALAIEDAEFKASALGLKLKLTEISELGCYGYYDGRYDKDGRHLVSVECNVSVVFERGS